MITDKTALIPGENFAVPSDWPTGTWGAVTSIGVTVANLHWKADPKKRLDPDWYAVNTRGLDPRTIGREFDLDWTVADGKPVFPEYDKGRHAAGQILRAQPGQPVYLGWDFGLNPAAVFVQPTGIGQVRVLRSLNESGVALNVFAPRVLRAMLALNAEAGFDTWTWEMMQARFIARWAAQTAAEPRMSVTRAQQAEAEIWRAVYEEVFSGGLEFIHVGDPAGKSRTANDAVSGYKFLQSHYGIRVRGNQKHQVWNTRRTAVSSWLTAGDVQPETPKFLISAHESCERLRAGFEGAYVYDENVDTGGREMPKKDRFSHPQDGLQYVACELTEGSGGPPAAASATQSFPLAGQAPPPPPAPESRWEALETDGPPVPKPAPQPWSPFLQSQMS